jgi:hypothetical protein
MIQKSLNAFTHEIAQELTLAQFYDQIRFNNHHAFLLLRNPTGDVFWEAEKKRLKEKLPVVWLNAKLDGKGMSVENVSSLTGLMFFDLDKLCHPSDQDQLRNAKEVISQIEFVSAVWVSPSGTGVHLVASVNPKNLNVGNFEQGWEYVLNKIIERVGDIGGVWDRSVKNANRKAFISKDPHIEVRSIVAELDIPKAILIERPERVRRVSGEFVGNVNTSKEYDKLHKHIICPNNDFMLQVLADNIDPEGAEVLTSLDGASEVGLWYREPLVVPYLRLGLSLIPEGRRNSQLYSHSAYFMYLNHPYINDDGMYKYARCLWDRVVKTGEYKTPEPIYDQLLSLKRNFDPSKLNLDDMKDKHAFYWAQATLGKTDKMILSNMKSGRAFTPEARELLKRQILDVINSLDRKEGFWPEKAKITIADLIVKMEAVSEIGGNVGKYKMRTFYHFCNNSPEIMERLRAANLRRPFTFKSAIKWMEFEMIHKLQPDRLIQDFVQDVSVSRKHYHSLKSRNANLGGDADGE